MACVEKHAYFYAINKHIIWMSKRRKRFVFFIFNVFTSTKLFFVCLCLMYYVFGALFELLRQKMFVRATVKVMHLVTANYTPL